MTRVTIALLSTAAPNELGSMGVFGDVVKEALTAHTSEFEVLPFSLCDPMPSSTSRLAQRLQLLERVVRARRRSGQAKACVYHLLDGSFAYMIGKIPWSRTLITVHDLIPALQAQGRIHASPLGWLAKRLINKSLERIARAGAVHAVSQNTAEDLRELTGRAADATILNPLRPLPKLQQTGGAATRHSGRSPYILHVGSNSHYKNRRGVLEIFSQVIEQRPDLRLVLAGPAPEPELRALASVPILEPRVSFVVDPDDEELAELYNGATLLLFPSIYEGFGWPPLEAAYYGCPVVCSRAASLPEVVGDAALMCDPADTSSFASAVIHLISDQPLARKLIENGYRNLKRFDDRRLGLGLSELYVKLIEKGAVRPSISMKIDL